MQQVNYRRCYTELGRLFLILVIFPLVNTKIYRTDLRSPLRLNTIPVWNARGINPKRMHLYA